MAASESAPDDSLYPIAVLIDELRNEDVQVGDIESRRNQNILEKKRMLDQIMTNFKVEPQPPKSHPRQKHINTLPTRHSERLNPTHLRSGKMEEKNDDYISDPEKLFLLLRNSKKRLAKFRTAPECIDDAYLADIASSSKVFLSQGTVCHLCNQRSLDSKTICRDPGCVGRRGAFCGPCLRNHYEEDAKEALMDKTWRCPPCRRICTCRKCLKRLHYFRPLSQQMKNKLGCSTVKDLIQERKIRYVEALRKLKQGGDLDKNVQIFSKEGSKVGRLKPGGELEDDPLTLDLLKMLERTNKKDKAMLKKGGSIEEPLRVGQKEQSPDADGHACSIEEQFYLKKIMKPFEGDPKIKNGCSVLLVPLPDTLVQCPRSQ